MTPYAKNLKRLREAKEWTQAKLAKKAGVHVAALSHWETGKREPNYENLEKLRKALGCEMVEFFSPNNKAEMINFNIPNPFKLDPEFIRINRLFEDTKSKLSHQYWAEVDRVFREAIIRECGGMPCRELLAYMGTQLIKPDGTRCLRWGNRIIAQIEPPFYCK